ncbi:MAG: hypothetical protein E4G98_03055 [Promethearchaeota archaeon]|nr:MAG: hypothetical protein E4G98_03055 [Candidatus Lokiarchaeota archaeon]
MSPESGKSNTMLKFTDYSPLNSSKKQTWDIIELTPRGITLRTFTSTKIFIPADEITKINFNFGLKRWVFLIRSKSRKKVKFFFPLNIPDYPAPILLISKINRFISEYYQLHIKSNIPWVFRTQSELKPEIADALASGEIHGHTKDEQKKMIEDALPQGFKIFKKSLIICEIISVIVILAMIVWQIILHFQE